MSISQREREILREVVTGYLATRCQLRFDAGQIKRAIDSRGLTDFRADQSEVDQALTFCEGLGFAKKCPAEMGATVYWQATSEGILAAERNGWSV